MTDDNPEKKKEKPMTFAGKYLLKFKKSSFKLACDQIG